jgi:hypothetical protein
VTNDVFRAEHRVGTASRESTLAQITHGAATLAAKSA